MGKRKILISALIFVILLLCSTVIATTLQKPKSVWKCGKKSNNLSYIFKTGDEYIIGFPENTLSINSILISSLDQKLPKRWKLLGPWESNTINKLEVLDSGFKYSNSSGSEGMTTTFDAKKGLLTETELFSSSAPRSVKCIKVDWGTATSEIGGALSGVPLKYLLLRSRMVELLNPKLGDKSFNIELAYYLTDIKNGEYSVYKLLSSLDRKDLTTENIDAMEQAKKKLLSSSSDEKSIWESSGMFTFYRDRVSEDAAREQCNRPSENLAYYTNDGYEIISSDSVTKDMGYGTSCQGTFYLLKKEGYID